MMTRKRRKKYRQELDPSLKKCHNMMYSDDPEMANLGLMTLKGVIYTYGQYKVLRGLSIEGKPFFPCKLYTKVLLWKHEILKNRISKKYLRKEKFTINN